MFTTPKPKKGFERYYCTATARYGNAEPYTEPLVLFLVARVISTGRSWGPSKGGEGWLLGALVVGGFRAPKKSGRSGAWRVS